MKTKTTITELTHDDLVDLFSTALTGSSYLSADYEESIEYDEKDCFEDILANILLHDGSIKVTDYYADGCVYGSLPHEYVDNDDEGEVVYVLTLDDIKRGLQHALDGTFKLNRGYEIHERRMARKAFESFVDEESNYDFDLSYADTLLQIILFDEIIYG